jgi:hypothetical protein
MHGPNRTARRCRWPRKVPAQKDFGFGLARYVEEIRNVEERRENL